MDRMSRPHVLLQCQSRHCELLQAAWAQELQEAEQRERELTSQAHCHEQQWTGSMSIVGMPGDQDCLHRRRHCMLMPPNKEHHMVAEHAACYKRLWVCCRGDTHLRPMGLGGHAQDTPRACAGHCCLALKRAGKDACFGIPTHVSAHQRQTSCGSLLHQ